MSGRTPALTDTRSAEAVEQELVARAQAWLPQWQFDEIPGDFGRALMYIAARMYGHVIDALARTPEKNQRGLLWWLGIGPAPPQAASMPVFFQLAPQADAVTAPQGTRVQASLDQPTIFETLNDVTVVPGTVAAVVGVNPTADQYFLASAGFPASGQPTNAQAQWTTMAPVSFPPTVLQLSSANGLASGQILLIAGQQFLITGLQSDVVTLSAPGPADPSAPAAPTSLPAGTLVELLDVFAPFAPTALPTQEHSLLLADDALLNLTGSATIEVSLGNGTLPDPVSWSYWGGQTPGWQPLTVNSGASAVVTLTKSAGASAPAQFGGISAHCLRATLSRASSGTVELSSIALRVWSGTEALPTPCTLPSPCPDLSRPAPAFLEYNAMWNNTPIATGSRYQPLGPMPRLYDNFYIGCAEAFGKAGALVTLCFDAASPGTSLFAVWPARAMMYGIGKDGRLQRLQLDSKAGTARFLRATEPRESDLARGSSTLNPIALQALPIPPPVVDASAHSVSVLVSSGHRVWMWTERHESEGSWTPLGESTAPIEGLVALRAASGVRVVALADGRLRSFELQPDRPRYEAAWEDLPLACAGGNPERIRMIAPVRTASEDFSAALVAVAASGRLWRFDGGVWCAIDAFARAVDFTVAPLSVALDKQTAYIVKTRERDQLAAWRSGSDVAPAYTRCELQSGLEVLRPESGSRKRSAEYVVADLTVLMLTKPAGEAPRVSWWRPFSDGEHETLFSQDPPAGPQPLAGTPTALRDLVVTAGVDAELFVSRLEPVAHGAEEARDIGSASLLRPPIVYRPLPVDSPILQWQYWNGSGWTILTVCDHGTDQLTRSARITFTAPADLATTIVAGKEDAWIRACLISGNYGLEKYDVTTIKVGKKTTSTAVPDDSSVKPPVLNSIDISYRICTPQAPAYVVTYDNGSYNDQSDANRAGGSAVVRAFVPLADALDTAAATPSSSTATTADDCGCGCGCVQPSTGLASSGAASASATASTDLPAIYVGFDQPIDPGTTISLLWELNDEDFTAVMPLQVAGVGPSGQMIPFTSGDYTRALGETQVLDVDVSAALPQINLFGQSLYWLCLQPARAGTWSPQITGVYLNGVWTAAQQTQQMETLGSSTGAPSAQFSLLSTPILDGSLELRVGESLADADLAALMLGNPDKVLIDPGTLSGDWVLWQQVPDLGVCQPTDRVYTLDETAGLITFGDGIHGMVPPVGQSNIIAFEYRSGGGSAANDFQPWGSLSLVSPVAGVSTVLAPEAAAGGSDATPIGSLLTAAPAMIAQRGRAITPRDLEQLALQSSPAIAQARCWQSGGGLQLVTLVTGDDVVPSLAQLRALNAYFAARTTPALTAALTVTAPTLVLTRITVSGNIASFDAAAQVSSDVESALEELFDPEIGGVDGTGWPLGRAPMDDDVVAVLDAIANLTAIVSVTLEQIDAQGNASPMPASFDPDEFPVLADAGVQFNIMAAAA